MCEAGLCKIRVNSSCFVGGLPFPRVMPETGAALFQTDICRQRQAPLKNSSPFVAIDMEVAYDHELGENKREKMKQQLKTHSIGTNLGCHQVITCS